MNKLNGSISIYFTFAIMMIISVIMSITEMARINCQKLYLQLATDAGLDSMASLYHRKLYEYYGQYGVEYKNKDLLETEYLSYMEPYFTDGDAYINNWYIAAIDEDHINLNFKTLIDENYLEKEISNYIKIKLIGKTINYLGSSYKVSEENDIATLKEKIEDTFEEIDKDDLYSEIYERYFDFEKDIKTLENHARTIMSYVDKVNIRLNGMKTMSASGELSNGRQIEKKMEALLEETDILKTALLSYKEKMNAFKNKVYESRESYIADRDQGIYSFTVDVCEFIESEYERFESFVDDYSDMNIKIVEGIESISEIGSQVEVDKRDVDAYVEELSDIEREIAYEMSLHSEEKDTDYIAELKDDRRSIQEDLSDYLKELKDVYKDYWLEPIEIIVSSSSHNDETNLLEKLVDFKNGVILSYVFDSSGIDKISKNLININNFNIRTFADPLSVDKILFGEYELDKFNYYNKMKNNEITKSGSEDLEMERMIAGKNSDLDNLKEIVNRILFMRIGLNTLYIYTHADKRQEVRIFTNMLFSGFSPLLAEAMFMLVLTAWGTAQGLVDVKKILNGKRVSFMHTEETWSVSLTELINIARNGIVDNYDTDDRGFALNYKDYLRILLVITNQRDINSRMAGIIERNIKKEQNSFDYSKLIYSFDTQNDFISKHLFTNFVFIPAKDITLYNQYKISIYSHRSYYD